MKKLARAVTGLALLAFAAPALPCGDKAQSAHASATTSEQAAKTAVAKSDKKAKSTTTKTAEAPKAATN
jgi:hypothetical protein